MPDSNRSRCGFAAVVLIMLLPHCMYIGYMFKSRSQLVLLLILPCGICNLWNSTPGMKCDVGIVAFVADLSKYGGTVQRRLLPLVAVHTITVLSVMAVL